MTSPTSLPALDSDISTALIHGEDAALARAHRPGQLREADRSAICPASCAEVLAGRGGQRGGHVAALLTADPPRDRLGFPSLPVLIP